MMNTVNLSSQLSVAKLSKSKTQNMDKVNILFNSNNLYDILGIQIIEMSSIVIRVIVSKELNLRCLSGAYFYNFLRFKLQPA
jgi:hypothetical protein